MIYGISWHPHTYSARAIPFKTLGDKVLEYIYNVKWGLWSP